MGGRFRFGAAAVALLLAAAALFASVAPSARAANTKPGGDPPKWAQKIIGVLAFVPESYRGSCEIFDTASDPTLAPFEADIVASVRCHPSSGADWVFYTEFDDTGVMDEAFDAFHPTEGDGSGDCPESGTWDQDGEDAGRWACYLSDKVYGVEEAAIVNWTHDESAILSNTLREDDDSDALDAWWSSDEAGPLPEPTSPGLPTAVSDPGRVAADLGRHQAL